MDNLEEQLGAVLSNPEMMQKIMALAQGFNASPPPEQLPPQEATEASFPNIDIGMIQKLSGLMRNTNIDREQQTLLSALSPYLSQSRLRKLENAMRASKLAGFAAKALLQNRR